MEELQHEHPESSTSSLLEGILLEVRAERQQKRLEKEISDYYSSLSDKENSERSEWGEFAMQEAAGGLEP